MFHIASRFVILYMLQRLCVVNQIREKRMAFTKSNIKQARTELETALEKWAKDWDVDVKIGTISYSEKDLRCKFTAVQVEEGKTRHETEIERDFARYAFRYDLDPEDLGKEVNLFDGEVCTIAGIKPRNHKFPIILKKKTGGFYKVGKKAFTFKSD